MSKIICALLINIFAILFMTCNYVFFGLNLFSFMGIILLLLILLNVYSAMFNIKQLIKLNAQM